ncbi:MAG: hypothetical protein ACXVGE_22395, partial [Blastococcus sp.]
MVGLRLVGLALLTALVGLCLVGVSTAASPSISSVVITGSQAHPVITIKGSGFGSRPAPNPAYHPPALTHRLCPAKPVEPLARYGWDFGTHLYLVDSSQHPAWAAGRYRPALGELDCIGLLLSKYTATEIVFRLGAAYPTIPGAPAHYALAAGDEYTVSV